MHILRLAEQFPPVAGGLAPGMLALSQAQQARGHTVTLFTRTAPDSESFDSGLSFPVRRLPARSLLHLGWLAHDALADLPFPPDIVHGHGPAAAAFLLRRRRQGPPVVVTLHSLRRYQYQLYRHLDAVVEAYRRSTGLPVLQPPRPFRAWSPHVLRELWLEGLICRRADHLALVAAYFLAELTAYGVSPQKCTVVYNGSDLGAAEATVGNQGGRRVIFIGRFDWHKRAHLLLQAWPLVQRHAPDTQLWLVGEGEQRADLQNLVAALGLENSVSLPGWLPHSQLAQVYAHAACLCLPSVAEGLSKVVLEAMSLAVPVLASDIPANRDVLADGALGRLVSQATPSAWAEAILETLNQPALAQTRAQLAQSVVRVRYRWAHVAERLDALYAHLLAQSG